MSFTNPLLLVPILVSFLVVVFTMPKWIEKCNEVGLLWKDMNKWKYPKEIASSGGLIVIMAFVLGTLFYIAFRTFFRIGSEVSLQIFAILSVILIFAIIGLTDDLLGWKRGGLSKRLRVLLAFLAAIPLIVINAGNSSMVVPFFGSVEFGLFYPLFLIPLGIAGCASVYNFLAGVDGLEASQGILILSFLSYVSYITNNTWLALVGLIMVASLLGFLVFNWSPAKVFPGDILTYSVGALIALMAILGSFQKVAVFVFIPFIIELCLKMRGKLDKYSFGEPQEDGSLELKYDKIYGLTHLGIFVLGKFKKKVYKKDVVLFVLGIHLVFILLAWVLFLL